VLDKRVLGDGYWLVRVFEFLQHIVGEIKVQGKGMVEIILGHIDFMLIYA
jgi:hypothetical protein